MVAKKKSATRASVGGNANRLSMRALNRATLARQMLLAREKTDVASALSRVMGLQAQWPKLPFLGLFARITNFSRADLAKAYVAKKVVRASLMRGTIHVVTADDYVALRSAIAPVLEAAMRVIKDRMKGMDLEKVLAESRAFLEKEPATFGDLRAHLIAKFPKADERAMGFSARVLLALVMAPEAESEKSDKPSAWSFPADARFALAEAFLKKKVRAEKDATQTLAKRYLAAFGPATAADFGVWSGLSATKEIFAPIRDELTVLHDERGRELFDLPNAPRPSEDTPAPVRYLPEFDSIIMAHKERERFVPTEHRGHVYLPALRVAQTIIVDGFVGANWAISREKNRAIVNVKVFAKISKNDRAELLREGISVAKFHEPDATSLDVVIKDV